MGIAMPPAKPAERAVQLANLDTTKAE